MITTGFSFYLDRERDPGIAPRHKHDCYELILYLSGSGVATVDGQDYPFSPGSLALVPPEVPHNDRYDSPTQVWCLGVFSDNAIPATVIGTDSDDFPPFSLKSAENGFAETPAASGLSDT